MTDAKKAAPAKKGPTYTYITKTIKGDTYLVLADSALELEDEFLGQYYTTANSTNLALLPPYEPKVLNKLPSLNNILNQCIEAMEVNIDGTGHEFIPAEEGGTPDQKEIDLLTDFFNEPYPGENFIKIRRRLRRDLESVGFAFLEVLRAVDGSIVAVRNVESYSVRYVRLDPAVQVQKTVTRNGEDTVLTLWERERRFVRQYAGFQKTFYKEFGASRQLDRFTGDWIPEGDPRQKDLNVLATELLAFGVIPDVQTPYGVPRWINNLPAVMGSRKAEELNLEFFDSGGMPPAIIFIQGGTLARDASDQLKQYLSGKNKHKNRAVVVEAMSTSGSLEAQGSVQVKVERFGAERMQDAMFTNYDERSEDHVRVAFRIPPLFIGRSTDYNYASAVVSYMVAEEQVFQPERANFDEIINKTIIKGLGIKNTKFKSKPTTMKNVDQQLAGMQVVAPYVKKEGIVDEVNKITNMTLEYDPANVAENPPMPVKVPNDGDGMGGGGAAPAGGSAGATGGSSPSGGGKQQQPRRSDAAMTGDKGTNRQDRGFESRKSAASELVGLAHDYAVMRGLIPSRFELAPSEVERVQKSVADLQGDDLLAFNRIIATYAFGNDSPDLVRLASCGHNH